jgi:hypothetical protein
LKIGPKVFFKFCHRDFGGGSARARGRRGNFLGTSTATQCSGTAHCEASTFPLALKSFVGTCRGPNSICNDVSVGPDHALYIANTINSKIYKLPAVLPLPNYSWKIARFMASTESHTSLQVKSAAAW